MKNGMREERTKLPKSWLWRHFGVHFGAKTLPEALLGPLGATSAAQEPPKMRPRATPKPRAPSGPRFWTDFGQMLEPILDKNLTDFGPMLDRFGIDVGRILFKHRFQKPLHIDMPTRSETLPLASTICMPFERVHVIRDIQFF